jgi:hypothetical protein
VFLDFSFRAAAASSLRVNSLHRCLLSLLDELIKSQPDMVIRETPRLVEVVFKAVANQNTSPDVIQRLSALLRPLLSSPIPATLEALLLERFLPLLRQSPVPDHLLFLFPSLLSQLSNEKKPELAGELRKWLAADWPANVVANRLHGFISVFSETSILPVLAPLVPQLLPLLEAHTVTAAALTSDLIAACFASLLSLSDGLSQSVSMAAALQAKGHWSVSSAVLRLALQQVHSRGFPFFFPFSVIRLTLAQPESSLTAVLSPLVDALCLQATRCPRFYLRLSTPNSLSLLLSKFGLPPVLMPLLNGLLSHPEPEIRVASLDALSGFLSPQPGTCLEGEKQAEKKLRLQTGVVRNKYIQNERDRERERNKVAMCPHFIQLSALWPSLVSLCADAVPGVRSRAAKCLSGLVPHVAAAELSSFLPALSEACIMLLSRPGVPPSLPLEMLTGALYFHAEAMRSA